MISRGRPESAHLAASNVSPTRLGTTKLSQRTPRGLAQAAGVCSEVRQ